MSVLARGSLSWVTALALVVVALPGVAAGQGPGGSAHRAAGRPTPVMAFTSVRIADPGDSVARGPRTVVVRDGRIVAIGPPDSVAIPGTAVRMDGGDSLYLSPGLVDSHVHLDFEPERWMGGFLAYGVTTVFNMRGWSRHLELRAAVVEGRLDGPAILTAGSYANRPMVETPAEARELVASQDSAGYHFIKIHGELDRATFLALVGAADSAGLPVIGHLPRNLPGAFAVEEGQAWIAHAEEVIYTQFGKLDTAGVGAFLDGMLAQDVALTPTLRGFRRLADQWGRPAAVDSVLALPEARLLTPRLRHVWGSVNPYTGRDPARAPWARDAYRFLRTFVDRAAEAGVPLLAGTDAPVPVMFPGASLIEELDELVDAGVPRRAAWRAATVNPARFVRERVPRADGEFGTVAPGAVARLVLLTHNPFETFDAYRRPVGVLVNDRWYDREALGALVATIPQEPERGQP